LNKINGLPLISSLQKQARRTEGGCLPKFPVLFQKISCSEGICPTHSRWQQFGVPIGLVGCRSEPNAGLPLACKEPVITGERVPEALT
jgi:hypothetical protein